MHEHTGRDLSLAAFGIDAMEELSLISCNRTFSQGPAAFHLMKGPDGKSIYNGRKATCFSNEEETMVGLTEAIPFLVESDIKVLLPLPPHFVCHTDARRYRLSVELTFTRDKLGEKRSSSTETEVFSSPEPTPLPPLPPDMLSSPLSRLELSSRSFLQSPLSNI